MEVFLSVILGILVGAFLQYKFHKLKRKEDYRLFLFKKRVEVYSDLMKDMQNLYLHEIMKDLDLLDFYGLRKKFNKKFLFYSRAKSIFVSAEVQKLIEEFTVSLYEINMSGEDTYGYQTVITKQFHTFCYEKMIKLGSQIEKEVSSSKILDNKDFNSILKGQTIEEAAKRLRKDDDKMLSNSKEK